MAEGAAVMTIVVPAHIVTLALKTKQKEQG